MAMHFPSLDRRDEQRLLSEMEAMADFLVQAFSDLSPSELAKPGPNGSFSPLEHTWHLADLERQGFAVRIRLLREGGHPQLPNFDGPAVARAGNYRARSFEEGLATFREARSANVAALRELPASCWSHRGHLEGVGEVSLSDMPAMMVAHDEGHRAEIAQWLSSR